MSENQHPQLVGSTTRDLVDRVKGFFRRKDNTDEDGIRLLFDQDEGRTGPLALYSPNPSTMELGTHDEPRRSRLTSMLGCCMSAVWFNRRRIWTLVGVLSLVFVATVSIRVFIWDRSLLPLKNAPSALPEYGTSLGCADAFYTSNPATLRGPIFSDGRHSVVITGGIVGTLNISGSEKNATEVEYDVKLATTDQGLLRAITLNLSGRDDTSTMRMNSIGFTPPHTSCHQRYDITVRIPPSVRHLEITTEATTHILFGRDAPMPKLETLTVDLQSQDHNNMLLSHLGVHADTLSFTMGGGLLSGNLLLVRNMTLRQSGYSWMLVDAVSADDPDLASVPTVLRTESGVGRSMITHRHFSGAAHRQIDSVHKAMVGQLDIDYSAADFEGLVEVSAGRVRANGALRGAVVDGARVKNKKMWVGRQEGMDQVQVDSPKGYVTLVF